AQRIGPLNPQANRTEPVDERFEIGLRENTAFLVAFEEDQLDVHVIDADLFEELQVLVILAVQPGLVEAHANADLAPPPWRLRPLNGSHRGQAGGSDHGTVGKITSAELVHRWLLIGATHERTVTRG